MDVPAAVTLMKPVSVPEVGAEGPIETVSDNGVFPPAGVTCSQLLAEKEVTVTFTDPGVEVTNTFCAGVVTPLCVLNVSCDGFAAKVVLCACAESKQHTKASSRVPTKNNGFSTVFTMSSRTYGLLKGRKKDAATDTLAIALPRPLDPGSEPGVSCSLR